METTITKQLAKQWNLTDLEEEPYILTPEEEKNVWSNELLSLQRHMAWKMKGLAYTDEQILEKFKVVDWEKELDRKEIYKRANSNKYYLLWQTEQREKEKQEIRKKYQDLLDKWTAKRVFQLMKWTSQNELGKQLIINPDNTLFIKTLCFFISNDERFEKELGYSFKKGLLIRGIAGIGKTHLVKCVAKNELHPIKILSMLEISQEVKEEGHYEISLGENKILYLDDVGTEESTVNHFGTKINFFKNFIEMIYLKNQNKTFSGLMVSTNNSFSEMEEKYGFRVRSRIKDMFNIIDVTGKDMRG